MKQLADARSERQRVERLGDDIHGAGSAELGDLLRSDGGGQERDANRERQRSRRNRPGDIQSAGTGQQSIQQDDVRAQPRPQHLQRLLPRTGGVKPDPGVERKRQFDDRRDIRVVQLEIEDLEVLRDARR